MIEAMKHTARLGKKYRRARVRGLTMRMEAGATSSHCSFTPKSQLIIKHDGAAAAATAVASNRALRIAFVRVVYAFTTLRSGHEPQDV